ncbi:fungal specific transcription factor [Fusarium oxysporum f. sp. phaseoli]
MGFESVSPRVEAEPVSETARQARNKRNISRSCYLCNHRKVRCDKKEPCSTCTRASKPCVYPSTGGRVRRPNKTIMADMASRIADLEKTLVKVNGTAEGHGQSPQTPVSVSEGALTVTPYHTEDRRDARGGEGVLVQKGSSSQYFNEILLSKVIEEVRSAETVCDHEVLLTSSQQRDVRTALTSPNNSASTQSFVSSPYNPAGILSSPSYKNLPYTFHPSRQLSLRLWSLYLENVESCPGLKVLHVPTDEVRVYSTIDGPSEAPAENLSLCFAAYYAALVSLSDRDAEFLMGQEKHTSAIHFKSGMEQALAHADFLNNPTLTGLQALAIYLSTLRIYNRGKGVWALNGLAICIAQSLGLHRDGERLGLSPFESEVRRRLWWHFLGRDGRAGEDYGLQNTVATQVSDVTPPLNVEDDALYPEMEKLPASRKTWTSMTSSLINVDLFKSLHKLISAVMAATPSNPPREEVRAQIITEAKASVERRLQHCNPAIPRQRLTINISRFMLRKMDLISRQQWQLLRCPGSREAFATEENLVEALEALDLGLTPAKDEMMKPFVWLCRAYPQYHLALYILWHLCVKPEGPNIERAWEAVNGVYLRELTNGLFDGVGPKALVLRALKTKAKAIREQIQAKNAAAMVQSSGENSAAHTITTMSPDRAQWEYPMTQVNIGGDAFCLNINGVEYPVWQTLVQEFQLDRENFPNVLW